MASKLAIANTSPQQTFQAIYLGTAQKITFASGNTQSSAVGSNTSIVRLIADVSCLVAIGSNPDATSGAGILVVANIPEYFSVNESDKIAATQVSASGHLYVTEGA